MPGPLMIGPELQWIVGIGIGVVSAIIATGVVVVFKVVDSAGSRTADALAEMTRQLSAHIAASEEESDDLRAAIKSLSGRVDLLDRMSEKLAQTEDVHRLAVQIAQGMAKIDGLQRLIDINAQTADRLEQWLLERGK